MGSSSFWFVNFSVLPVADCAEDDETEPRLVQTGWRVPPTQSRFLRRNFQVIPRLCSLTLDCLIGIWWGFLGIGLDSLLQLMSNCHVASKKMSEFGKNPSEILGIRPQASSLPTWRMPRLSKRPSMRNLMAIDPINASMDVGSTGNGLLIVVLFCSPLAYLDPLRCSQTCLLSTLFHDALNEYTYAAELAGLGYSLNSTKYGLQVIVGPQWILQVGSTWRLRPAFAMVMICIPAWLFSWASKATVINFPSCWRSWWISWPASPSILSGSRSSRNLTFAPCRTSGQLLRLLGCFALTSPFHEVGGRRRGRGNRTSWRSLFEFIFKWARRALNRTQRQYWITTMDI